MQRHQWRENEDETVRFYRAEHHAGRWRLFSQLKGEDEWNTHDPIKREEWEKLRDVLFRKYQRKRCPWQLVEKIDKVLEKMDAGEDD